MVRLRTDWALQVLAACSLVSACASAPRDGGPVSPVTISKFSVEDNMSRLFSAQGEGSARYVGPIQFGLDGALPLVHTRSDPLLASRFGVGSDDGLLRYNASYSIVPGDVLGDAETPAAPQRLGGQRVGQNLRMRLPKFAGAPVSLGYSAEALENWTMAGTSVEQQRQVANLDWSPRLASLNLQWADGNAANDPQLALGCDLRGTVRVPLRYGGLPGKQALRVSGRGCRVLAGPRYDSLEADTWGLAYVWNQPRRETQLLVSAIDPAWDSGLPQQDIEPSYEFGVSHRRDYGIWSARGQVGMRYATVWDLAVPDDTTGNYFSDSDAYWTMTASLTRRLPAVSITANWAHGADPMWFLPETGQRRHRFGMVLDLSRLVEGLLPDATPQVGMRWNWTQARSRQDALTADSVVHLNMAVMW